MNHRLERRKRRIAMERARMRKEAQYETGRIFLGIMAWAALALIVATGLVSFAEWVAGMSS